MTKRRFDGGKNGAGVYQRVISLMPPHDLYVEPFLGSGAVMLRKRPAALNVGIDLDGDVVRRAAGIVAGGVADQIRARLFGCDGVAGARFEFVCGDGISYLELSGFGPRDLVYCDPPYLMATRSSKRRLYRYEMDDGEHRRLLRCLVSLPCMVMLQGYPSEMYDEALSSWRVVGYRAVTSSGRVVTECLWYNFPEPVELHDYSYVGRDFRDRARIQKKRVRWVRMLAAMPDLERGSMLASLEVMRAGKGGLGLLQDAAERVAAEA
jgi:DNA adenine methylase